MLPRHRRRATLSKAHTLLPHASSPPVPVPVHVPVAPPPKNPPSWSPPPPPPLPSHHHGPFLCPLRSLSSQNQWTPLHYASQKGEMAVAELLVEKGADVDARNKVRPTLPPHTHIAAASLFSRCCPFLTPSLSPFHTGSLLPLLVFPPSCDS